jgi:1,4-alpha-glucan branching enzyme
LPLSHDEVVHGKKSLIDKMYGEYAEKFDSYRTFLTYYMTVPGKKLMFMGGEIGQFREWAYADDIEWFLLDYDAHARHQLYMADLNNLYLKYPSLWQVDDSWSGFQWIDADNKAQSILSYRRISENGKELIVVLNFTPVAYEDHCLRVPAEGTYEEILNSDDEKYGGSGVTNKNVKFESHRDPLVGLYSEGIRLRIPPLGAVILRMTKKRPAKKSSEEKAPADKPKRKKTAQKTADK